MEGDTKSLFGAVILLISLIAPIVIIVKWVESKTKNTKEK